jgi:hypothetical protein
VPAPNQSSMLVFLAIAALVAWRMHARFRRLVGRQRFSPRRPWVTVTLFPLLLAVIAVAIFPRVDAGLALLGGLIAGAGLGLYGIRLTKFERTADGLFYTPSAHIGIALSALLAGRVLYRLATQLPALTGGATGPPPGLASSPLTLAIVGTLAGYYVTYAIGLLRFERRAPDSGPPGAHPPA